MHITLLRYFQILVFVSYMIIVNILGYGYELILGEGWKGLFRNYLIVSIIPFVLILVSKVIFDLSKKHIAGIFVVSFLVFPLFFVGFLSFVDFMEFGNIPAAVMGLGVWFPVIPLSIYLIQDMWWEALQEQKK